MLWIVTQILPDLNSPDPRVQTIFRNLKAHEMALTILHLPYKQSYHTIFKTCYLFLKQVRLGPKVGSNITQFCKGNRRNQALLFPYRAFMMSQMGLKLNIADT